MGMARRSMPTAPCSRATWKRACGLVMASCPGRRGPRSPASSSTTGQMGRDAWSGLTAPSTRANSATMSWPARAVCRGPTAWPILGSSWGTGGTAWAGCSGPRAGGRATTDSGSRTRSTAMAHSSAGRGRLAPASSSMASSCPGTRPWVPPARATMAEGPAAAAPPSPPRAAGGGRGSRPRRVPRGTTWREWSSCRPRRARGRARRALPAGRPPAPGARGSPTPGWRSCGASWRRRGRRL
mmetsp:Transcript_85345/g.264300  ORF Transcript_85345/g.264300 Transcript_85345/m.264300 type:complete len:240 (-) Transcript_85345:6-725(-)